MKLAASILVCFSASRQSKEFPANAIIAMNVRMKTRVSVTIFISVAIVNRDMRFVNSLRAAGRAGARKGSPTAACLVQRPLFYARIAESHCFCIKTRPQRLAQVQLAGSPFKHKPR